MIETKDVLLTVRTTPERRALYHEFAERDGMRLSDWMRYLADQRVAQAVVRQGLAADGGAR